MEYSNSNEIPHIYIYTVIVIPNDYVKTFLECKSYFHLTNMNKTPKETFLKSSSITIVALPSKPAVLIPDTLELPGLLSYNTNTWNPLLFFWGRQLVL